MSKYRELSKEELELFRQDFIDFLVVNGIDADEWQESQENNPGKAAETIRIFTDFIFDTVLRKIKYIDGVGEGVIRSFQCLDDKIVLVGADRRR